MSRAVLRQEKGMVLLLVLVIVALLSALLTEFAFSTLVDLRLAETYRDSTRAYYLARGGIRAGQMLLRDDRNATDSRDEMWARGVAGFPIGDDGTIDIAIEDLDGRLAINALVDSNNNPQVEQKARFIRLFEGLALDAPQDLVAALIDWRDMGDDVYDAGGAQGAESAYYQGLSPPYQARNGKMASLEELHLIRGFTPELVEQITPFVTLDGSQQVNINTAPPEVIAALSYENNPVTLEEAGEIAAVRDLAPFAGPDDFREEFPGLWDSFPTGPQVDYRLKYASDLYRIRSQAWINDGTRAVTAVVQKSKNRILFLRVD